jgi:hypothetical protein
VRNRRACDREIQEKESIYVRTYESRLLYVFMYVLTMRNGKEHGDDIHEYQVENTI